MTRTFVYIKKFSDKWDELGLTDDDLLPLEEYLLKHPKAGAVVQGTGGIRKLRWALPSKGKSGGIRLAYVDIVICEKMYMLDLFPKSDKDNYTDAEKKILKKLVTDLKNESRKAAKR